MNAIDQRTVAGTSLPGRVISSVAALCGELWQENHVPPHLRSRHSDTMKSGATIVYTEARVGHFGEIHFSAITGPSTEIFALMGYPAASVRIPILAAEFVRFGGQLRAVVADLQCPDPSFLTRDAQVAMLELGARWGHLRDEQELPEWCRSYFSPSCIFSLRRQADELPTLEAALRDYTEAWIDIGRSALALSGVPSENPAVREYKAHHALHTPGRPYLRRVFGEDWTEDFLTNAMYR
jgi:hypothetical protein